MVASSITLVGRPLMLFPQGKKMLQLPSDQGVVCTSLVPRIKNGSARLLTEINNDGHNS